MKSLSILPRCLSILSQRSYYYMNVNYSHYQNIFLKNNSCVDVEKNYLQPFRQTSTMLNENPSLLKRVKQRLAAMVSDTTRINVSTCYVYEKIADRLDFVEFFKFFNLPDTFHSWFLVIELHVWMCLLICISEKNGRHFRNKLVEFMWKDVEIRLTKLEHMSSSVRKEYLKEIQEQFHAAIIAFDEGILGNDTVLANAIWRTIFNKELTDPLILEKMVIYIRKQLSHLDSLDIRELMLQGELSLLSLNEIFSDVDLN